MGVASAVSERRRILLVDDVELNRVLTEAVLRSAPYEVDSVGDGASALAALETRTYDLVLLDLEMPGLDGHAAAAAIRCREVATAKNRGVRLAAISARNETSVRLKSAEVGMAAHIARPIAPHELLRQIESVFCRPASDPEPDIWHRDPYDDWVSRLGAERMTEFLLSLLHQFRDLLTLLATAVPVTDLHRLAHDVASTGGMLGFPDVTRCCRALLEAAEPATDKKARDELESILKRAVARLDRHFSSMENVADEA